jgi:Flp pilus assembly protein TadD
LLNGDHNRAIQLLRKVIYLAPSLAMAHFMLGSVLQRVGDRPGAERHLRNAVELADARAPGETIPLSDGGTAAALAAAARNAMKRLLRDTNGRA